MTVICMPMDAVAGAPVYTAQHYRQAQAALHGAGSGRPLGGRSGFRLGTPPTVLTATATQWSLAPVAAEIDPGATLTQGVYGWASNSTVTGAIQPADATYDRKDIVYIQVSDSSAGDGSGALQAPVKYLAGTPAASPVAPALPPRSLLVGTITVPKVGGGNPSVVVNPARVVAAGAKVPVSGEDERDALVAFNGLEVYRTDKKRTELFTGSAWVPVSGILPRRMLGRYLESTIPSHSETVITGGWQVRPGDDESEIIYSGGRLTVPFTGIYDIRVLLRYSSAGSEDNASGRFVSVRQESDGANLVRNFEGAGSYSSLVSASGLAKVNAGDTLYVVAYQNSGQSLTLSMNETFWQVSYVGPSV